MYFITAGNKITTTFWLKIARLIVVVFVVLGVSPSYAQPKCEPVPNSITELELMKHSFAFGKYDEFFEFVGRKTGNDQQTKQFVGKLAEAFPNGFLSCSTIFSEMKSDRMVKELIVFEAPDEQPFFLYWLAIIFKGNWTIVQFQVSTEFKDISDNWR